MPAARRLIGRTAAGSVKRGQPRRLPISVPVRRGAGLCAVVRRHRQTAARRRVIAGITQPRLCLCAGLAVLGQGMDAKSLAGFALVLASIFGVQRAVGKAT